MSRSSGPSELELRRYRMLCNANRRREGSGNEDARLTIMDRNEASRHSSVGMSNEARMDSTLESEPWSMTSAVSTGWLISNLHLGAVIQACDAQETVFLKLKYPLTKTSRWTLEQREPAKDAVVGGR